LKLFSYIIIGTLSGVTIIEKNRQCLWPQSSGDLIVLRQLLFCNYFLKIIENVDVSNSEFFKYINIQRMVFALIVITLWPLWSLIKDYRNNYYCVYSIVYIVIYKIVSWKYYCIVELNIIEYILYFCLSNISVMLQYS
jgi:hypothetical protein